MATERTDVLIVGAGPAGLAAAAALRRLGAGKVTVVEREASPGGTPRLCHHTGFGVQDLRWLHTGPGYARRYVRLAEAAGVDLQTSTTITGWQGMDTLTYSSPRGLGTIQAQAILLATGCRERPRAARLIPGGRPQGVYTTGSLQRFVYEHHLPVGRRAVIVGAELVSLSALMTLGHAGASAAAMVTALPRHQVYFPYLPAKWAVADVLTRTPVIGQARVSRIVGKGRVEAVEVTHLADGRTERLECDTVVFTGDWTPENEVARLGGLRLDAGTRGPRVDGKLRTSARGVFAAGNLLHGAETADVCALEGRAIAGHIAAYLQDGAWPEQAAPVQADGPITWVFPNAVSPGSNGDFTFRVREFAYDAEVLVQQGARTLHTQRYGRLSPNASMRLRGEWAEAVEAGGEAVRVAARER